MDAVRTWARREAERHLESEAAAAPADPFERARWAFFCVLEGWAASTEPRWFEGRRVRPLAPPGSPPLRPSSVLRFFEEAQGWEAASAPDDEPVFLFERPRPLALSRSDALALDQASRRRLIGGRDPRRPDRIVEPGRTYLRPNLVGRKTAGAFYTPKALARSLVGALFGRRARAGGAILDPACGAGALLLEVLEQADRIGTPPVEVARRRLLGLDVDEWAAAAARIALSLALGGLVRPEELSNRVRAADALETRRPPEGSVSWVVVNPPWESLKPNRREWFASRDPLLHVLPRERADERIAQLVEREPSLQKRFEEHAEKLRGRREAVSGEAGDANAWRLFLWRCLAWLAPGGRIGAILPAGIVSELGARRLRRRLFEEFRLESLRVFVNRRGRFPIHRQWRVALLVAQRARPAPFVEVSFDVEDPELLDRPGLRYPLALVRAASPRAWGLVQTRTAAELSLLERMLAAAVPLGDVEGFRYRREFDLTSDRGRFRSTDEAFERGARLTAGGRLVGRDGRPLARVLLQGRMIRPLRFPAATYEPRVGWREASRSDPICAPRAVGEEDCLHRLGAAARPKVGLRDVQNAANVRTLVAALLPPLPCGNTLPVVTIGGILDDLVLLGWLSSLAADRVARWKVTQNHVNRFVVEELPFPTALLPGGDETLRREVARRAARLALDPAGRAPARSACEQAVGPLGPLPEGRRARIEENAALDVAVLAAYGLDADSAGPLLAGCDHPRAELKRLVESGALDPRGFHRVDADLPPAERLPVRVRRLLERAGSPPA